MIFLKTVRTVDGYLWTRSSLYQGGWLDLGAIKGSPYGSINKTMKYDIQDDLL